MEQKVRVGDVVYYNGKKYRALPQVENSCKGCAFVDASDCPCGNGDCYHEEFIFKELAAK